MTLCYEWTNDPNFSSAMCDTKNPITSCPTAGVTGTCTFKQGGGSFSEISYANCSIYKMACTNGAGGTWSGSC